MVTGRGPRLKFAYEINVGRRYFLYSSLVSLGLGPEEVAGGVAFFSSLLSPKTKELFKNASRIDGRYFGGRGLVAKQLRRGSITRSGEARPRQ